MPASGPVPPADDLPDLLRRLKAGEPEAGQELVRRYSADIRRIARVRLTRFGLRHLIDSEDVAQSVFGRFLHRLHGGGWQFESPEKLLHLLAVIAANWVTTHARRERHRVRPAGGADSEAGSPVDDRADSTPAAERVAAARDQLGWVLRALTADDQAVFLARADGRAWAELAAERGMAADALRKRFTRALDEAGVKLGMGDSDA